ncbi:MAG: hypothetical protein ACFFDW_02430 [Candidatus Thorarchaeota archaeon]
MAINPFLNLDPGLLEILFIVAGGLALIFFIVMIGLLVKLNKSKKGVDVSALAALASSDAMGDEAAPNADPKEVMAILQIERIAASTALSAVKDAQKSRKISSGVHDSLINRYKARIAKIDGDMKRRSGVQEYRSLAESLEQSRDRLRDEVMPTTPTPPTTASSRLPLPPPPPPSKTPGIPSTAPLVPGVPRPPTTGPPTVPTLPSSGMPSLGTPPSTPSSPIPIPPKIAPITPSSKPSTVVPPSVAPPTVSSPPLPPKIPTAPTTSSITPPTTSNMAPPPVPTSVPTTPPPTTTDGDTQSISGLRMEMLRELARLKKFMSEETQ